MRSIATKFHLICERLMRVLQRSQLLPYSEGMVQNQDGKFSVNQKMKIRIFLFAILGLLALGSILSDTEPGPTPTAIGTSASVAPQIPQPTPLFQTSGCNRISSETYEVVSKLGGIGDTYTPEDVEVALLTAGEAWATWSVINSEEGKQRSSEWLTELSESALKLRVAIRELDAEGTTANGERLLSATEELSKYCP